MPRNLLSVVSEFAVGADVSIQSVHALDAEFGAEGGDGGVAFGHCGLSQTDLGLGEGKFPAALAAPCAGGGKSRDGPFADEIALKFGQGREDAENHAARRGGGVDLRAFPGEHSQADFPIGQVPDGVRTRWARVRPQPIEFPDNQYVAGAKRAQTGLETGPIIAAPGSAVLVNLVLSNASGAQGVELEVEGLRTVGFGLCA